MSIQSIQPIPLIVEPNNRELNSSKNKVPKASILTKISLQSESQGSTVEDIKFCRMMWAVRNQSTDLEKAWTTLSEIFSELSSERADFFAEWAFHFADFNLQLKLEPRIARILQERGELSPTYQAKVREDSSDKDSESSTEDDVSLSSPRSESTTGSETNSRPQSRLDTLDSTDEDK